MARWTGGNGETSMFSHVVTGPLPVRAPRPSSRRIRPAVLLAIAAATPLVLPSTAADAADMPVKAPAAKSYNWRGCYLGLNGGGAESGSDFTTTVAPGTHLGVSESRWSRGPAPRRPTVPISSVAARRAAIEKRQGG